MESGQIRAAPSMVAVAVTAMLLFLVACPDDSHATVLLAHRAPQLVVLGIDGLDLRMLDDMVGRGLLPNFDRLYHEGAVGPVSTREAGLPPLSPAIWTSFATGQLPSVHGINGFIFTDAAGVRRLYSSDARKSPALWEIASAAGKSVGVVNWWFTHPTEPIRGFVISDRYRPEWSYRLADFHHAEYGRKDERVVHPPELADLLARATVQICRRAENAQAAEEIDRNVFDLTFIAVDALPVDVLMIYTRALDELSHLRWQTHERLHTELRQHDDIADYLQRYDGLLGALLARLDSTTHLIVLSDHGFERSMNEGRPYGVHLSLHTAAGTLILHGPRIASGIRLDHGDTLLDVLPTALEILGIPPAQNMEGRVLDEAFRHDGGPRLARVPAYARGDRPAPVETGPGDSQILDRFRALGYLK